MTNFFFFIWLVYSAGLIYPNIERYTLYNELFSLLGILLTFHYLNVKYTRLNKIDMVYFLFVFYGFFLLIISGNEIMKSGAYLSLRTMPIFYNVFGFMVGCYLYYHFIRHQQLNNPLINKLMLLVSLITPWRLSPQVFAMFFLKSYKGIFLYLLCFLIINGGSTSITAFVFVAIVYLYKKTYLIKKYWSNKILYVFLILFFLLLSSSGEIYQIFLDVGYEDVFAMDVNLTWRYMFWVYLFQEVISQHPLMGIGFGAPLFYLDLAPEFLTSDDGSRNTEYTLGTHNSIIFLLARMGIIGLVLVLILHILIYAKAFRKINKEPKTNKVSETELFLLANFMFLNSALFNVVLETPLYGGLYWITLGVLYGSLKLKGEQS